MNFMLLSILCSFPCISGRLKCKERRNVYFPPVSVKTNPARPFLGCGCVSHIHRSSRLPGGGIFGTVAAYAKPLPAMISPPLLPPPSSSSGGNKTATGKAKRASKPARKYFPGRQSSLSTKQKMRAVLFSPPSPP